MHDRLLVAIANQEPLHVCDRQNTLNKTEPTMCSLTVVQLKGIIPWRIPRQGQG